MNGTVSDLSHYARWLGYAGLLPFLGAVVVLITGPIGLRELALNSLLNYAAIILAFMGAIHWGRAMYRDRPDSDADNTTAVRDVIVSVVPALVAWGALFLQPRASLICLAAAFAALFVYERTALKPDAAAVWYLSLRIRLTSVVIVCLVVAAIGL